MVFVCNQGNLEGLGECRDQHGHGLGLGVDNFLVYTYDKCFQANF